MEWLRFAANDRAEEVRSSGDRGRDPKIQAFVVPTPAQKTRRNGAAPCGAMPTRFDGLGRAEFECW
jgi:hypothetical protein